MKKFIILSILFFLYVSISAFSYVNAVSCDLSKSVFRLHVIANSDSAEDQNLKYIVRDNIINYMKTLTENAKSKEETINLVSCHLSDFEDIANKTIKDNGFDYTAKVSIGNFNFPTKKYGDISFPAGYYDALKIQLGNSNGQNWWCVLYPSLCFIDISSGFVPEDSKETLESTLNEEEYKLISDANDQSIKIKFKLIELFNKNNLLTAKN
jgi:stage II sporulation protein R